MRVTLVTTSWPAEPGDPAGHFVRAEARALEQSGHEVAIVSPTPGGAFGWPGVTARLRERPARALEAARWVSKARAQIANATAERVVSHWAVPCAWPIGVAARKSATLEAVSHGGDVRLLTAIPSAPRHRIVSAIASRAERWRFVSDALMDALLRTLVRETQAYVRRIARVQPAALEVPDMRRAVTQLRRELGGMRVAVSVGRLVDSKRVDRIIEHVAQSRGLDALVVVGDGPQRKPLERLACDRGVRARFLGTVPREEALAWIGAAAALLHASEAEGLSTVVREAEALGTPVVRVGRFGAAARP
jgi:teichuronic acid biosynthesis glycosyltransferase TuaC